MTDETTNETDNLDETANTDNADTADNRSPDDSLAADSADQIADTVDTLSADSTDTSQPVSSPEPVMQDFPIVLKQLENIFAKQYKIAGTGRKTIRAFTKNWLRRNNIKILNGPYGKYLPSAMQIDAAVQKENMAARGVYVINTQLADSPDQADQADIPEKSPI